MNRKSSRTVLEHCWWQCSNT